QVRLKPFPPRVGSGATAPAPPDPFLGQRLPAAPGCVSGAAGLPRPEVRFWGDGFPRRGSVSRAAAPCAPGSVSGAPASAPPGSVPGAACAHTGSLGERSLRPHLPCSCKRQLRDHVLLERRRISAV